MSERWGLAGEEANEEREDSDEDESDDEEEDDRSEQKRFADLDLFEEAAGDELPPGVKLPEDDASEDEQGDVQVVSLEEGDGRRSRGAELVQCKTSSSAEESRHE